MIHCFSYICLIYLYLSHSIVLFSLQLANVLQIDLKSVKNAVSLYCRLGFAKKKSNEVDDFDLDPSWNHSPSLKRE